MKNKPFIVANVRDILDLYDKEEISFSKMVEMLNDIAEKFYKEQNVTIQPDKLFIELRGSEIS